MMISESTNPVISRTKYMVDLNEEAYQSRPRLYGFFRHVATSEMNMKKSEVNKNIARFERSRTLETMVRAMDKKIGKHVIFYWGNGDEEEIVLMPSKPVSITKKRTTTTTKKKKDKDLNLENIKDSMSALEKNLKDAAVK